MRIQFVIATTLFFYTTVATAQRTVNIPYFDPIENSVLCGRGTCCPSTDICAAIKNGFFFTNITNVLGRAYRGKPLRIFDTKDFLKPSDSDIENPVSGIIKGKISTQTKKEFGSKISGGLDELLQTLNLNQIKTALKAEISKAVENNGSADVDMEYYSANLSTDFINKIDGMNVTKKTYVITGLYYLKIKGNWTLNTLTDALRNFELTAAFLGLNAEAKGRYKSLKDRVLTATFSVSSMAIKVSHRMLKP